MKLHEIDFKEMKYHTLIDNKGDIWTVTEDTLVDSYEERIENLLTLAEISQLEFLKSNYKGWEESQVVYRINDIGDILGYTLNNTAESVVSHKMCYSNCNEFSTKRKAIEIANEQLLYRKIKKFRDENDKEVDWINKSMMGYCIEKDSFGNRYGINASNIFRGLHTIYFTTEELAKKCLDEIVLPFIKNKNV